MTHVIDELELYVLGALPPASAARVAEHVAACHPCAAEARALEAAVSALHDTLPAREPPARLRDRILASARMPEADRRGGREDVFVVQSGRPRPAWRRWAPAAAVAASIVLAAVAAGAVQQAQQARADLEASQAVARRVSQPASTWYMSGVDRWQGSGGMFYAPKSGPAFVVFHDLPAAPAGQSYTIWLVDADGRWIRGSSFTSAAVRAGMVDVGIPVAGFDRCAVTIESRAEGKREGPIVMQSLFY